MTCESSQLPKLSDRDERLRQLLHDVMQQRVRGVPVDQDKLVREFPDLLPELANELDKLNRIHVALQQAESARYARAIERLQGSSSSGGLSTGSTADIALRTHEEDMEQLPPVIGRYEFRELLGKGGFGRVYLARDLELARNVAVKLPHRHRLRNRRAVDHFLAEARALAALDHPSIVPVYDMGRMPEGGCYIVSKWIEGTNLALRIRTTPLEQEQSLRIMVRIADALAYAHQRGIVHRDLKPANILLDRTANPYLVDFGGIIAEEDLERSELYIGTPAYMSPEQARGETHRIDGRSDIFSLGIVFYEMLIGVRPFQGNSPDEMLRQIIERDATPPSLLNPSISAETERICLKALSKRAADRYQSAQELLDDLSHCLDAEQASLPHRMAAPASPRKVEATRRIIPKGLRAFDAHDAGFFLELLPGPRDRDGLPESIRQWKNRVESLDPDESFAVGLLYGRSGSGKSSFVRAGLLPRLASQVQAIYVEATSDGTEESLLRKLISKIPALADCQNLSDALANLRRGIGLSADHKLLLVIDQFEQWLHGKNTADRRSLVQALRHCDGVRLQCLLLVRDDFWLAISRFMDELEIELVQGRNIALVDLFDPQHARKVLMEFGRAFSRLSDDAADLHPAEDLFLDRAIESLSEADEGKVIPVRLALFAEMVKGRAWNLTTLDELGGAEGVGATFLEEMFCSRSASPQHRLHERGARAVLEALLPDPTSNIKGHIRSYPELLDISGYGNNPRGFKELMRILDGETRLLTPTEPPIPQTEAALGLPAIRYYQLTHDYLVPSLRAWLTMKQKMTLTGRAELRLTERAKLWGAHPEGRQLPSLWEWLAIRVLTRPANWTPPQRRMMQSALRRQSGYAMTVAVVLLAFLIVGAEATSIAKDSLVWFRVNTAPAWLAFGQEEAIWSLLRDESDPTLRTRLIHRLRSLFVDSEDLMAGQAQQDDVAVRRALLLAAGEGINVATDSNRSMAGNRRESETEFVRQLVELYQNDIDPGIHSAAEWALRRLDQREEMARADAVLQASGQGGDRQWYVTPQGHTMVVIPGPTQYLMGSPAEERGRRQDERVQAVHIRHSYSIASKETTIEQFQRFVRSSTGQISISPMMYESPTSPQTMVNWYQAAAYCNWLSQEEGIPESQWCYRPNVDDQYAEGMSIVPDFQQLSGYRLPTEKEWEYACRARATTARYFGRTDSFIQQYAVCAASQVAQPAGTGHCKPNDFGLFDMLGNAAEWCQDAYRDDLRATSNSQQREHDKVLDNLERVVRGGSYLDPIDSIRCAARDKHPASQALASVGFRIARNYP